MGQQPRKAKGSGQATAIKAIRQKLSKPSGAHIMTPLDLDAGHGAIGDNDWFSRFSLALIRSSLVLLLVLSFRVEIVTLWNSVLGDCNFFFAFYFFLMFLIQRQLRVFPKGDIGFKLLTTMEALETSRKQFRKFKIIFRTVISY